MKTALLTFSIIAFSLFGFKVNALELSQSTGIQDGALPFTVELKAAPPADPANAVSVRLSIIGGEFLDFIPSTGNDWIGVTRDCANQDYFTKDSVCFSVAKSTNLVNGEVLGTLTFAITDTSSAKILKAEGNKYSNDQVSFDDKGDLGVFYSESVISETMVSFPDDVIVTSTVDNTVPVVLLIIILLLGIIVGGVLLLKKRTNLLNSRNTQSKGKVLALIVGLGVLAVSIGVIALSLNQNQAPSATDAATASDVGLVACGFGLQCSLDPKTGATQCNNNGTLVYCCPANYTLKGENCVINASSTCTPGQTKCVGTRYFTCSTNGLWSELTGTNNCSSENSNNNNGGSSVSDSGSQSSQNSGSTGSSGTGGSTTTNATASKAICGGTCNVDSDCAVSQFGFQPKCQNKVCVNPICPNDYNANPQCACKTATSKCGDKCGIWSDGFYPLCGDGKSSCSWVNGPSCGGNNQTYCLPTTVPAGYSKPQCTQVQGYSYITDQSEKAVTSQAAIQELCAQMDAKKKCYRCTVSQTDGNTCEETQVNQGVACPSGYSESSNCAQTAGGSCPTEQVLLGCGAMDSNDDEKLTVIDFASFAQVYNKSCTNVGQIYNNCGSRDVNSDSKIDIVDFASFASRYGKDSCVLSD